MAALQGDDPNVALLEVVARHLGDALRQRLVFVGGAVVGLLITDPGAPAIRPTEDVDLIAHVLAPADFRSIERSLRARGFTPDMRPTAPICRWTIDGVTVDVMPTIEEILGFSNRWYPLAVQTAQALTLPSGTDILTATAPLMIATKLEAFAGRGAGDYLFSHDLGDVVSLIDGRETLLSECAASPIELRRYLADRLAALLATSEFIDALPGHLPTDAASQARLSDIEAKLQRLAGLLG